MRSDRKGFLQKAAAVVAAAAAGPLIAGAPAGAADSRVATKYLLLLDGQPGGWLLTAGVTGQTIPATAGPAMSSAFFNWLKASFGGGGPRKNGAIVSADSSFSPIARTEFSNAMLTDIGFPALDGSSKDPAYMSLKISTEGTKFEILNAAQTAAIAVPAPGPQKIWNSSNFRLTIPGVDCKYVLKIDGIRSGGSTLAATLPASHVLDFVQWKTHPVSKPVTLEYLEPNDQSVFFKIDFAGVQLTNVAKGADQVKVTMSYGGARLAQTP